MNFNASFHELDVVAVLFPDRSLLCFLLTIFCLLQVGAIDDKSVLYIEYADIGIHASLPF